eukprot:512416-Amphidinium_carterae.1
MLKSSTCERSAKKKVHFAIGKTEAAQYPISLIGKVLRGFKQQLLHDKKTDWAPSSKRKNLSLPPESDDRASGQARASTGAVYNVPRAHPAQTSYTSEGV